LVQVDDSGEEARYGLLETIRQYALGKLVSSGEAEAVRDRHRDWYLNLAERAEPHLVGADQAAWLEVLARERGNLRATLTWCWNEANAEVGLRVTAALEWFWYVRDNWGPEGSEWLERFLALAAGPVPPTLQVKALAVRLMFDAGVPGRPRMEATWAEFRLLCEQTGDRASLVRNHWWMGRAALWEADYPRAQVLFREGITLAREAGDNWALAQELEGLGWVAEAQGENADACRWYEESLANFRPSRDWRAIAWSLLRLGETTCLQGNYPAARRCLEEAEQICRRLQHEAYLSSVLRILGMITQIEGNYVESHSLLNESLSHAEKAGHRFRVFQARLALCWLADARWETVQARALLHEAFDSLWAIDFSKTKTAICIAAILAVEVGNAEQGARLFGHADGQGLRPTMLPPDVRRAREERTQIARMAIGNEAFEAAWAIGQAMTPEEAVVDAKTGDGSGA
jgi:tetratricopeptide (TPR) repeat protein